MNHKFFFIIAIFLVTVSCESKKQFKSKPLSLDRSYEIYSQAVTRMESGDWFYAHKKFAQAELLMQDIDHAAQSLLMSSYCLYQINFYPEAQASLENFISKYPANKNIAYVKYLNSITYYEQILDEKKDITPLLKSKEVIQVFIKDYPNTDYALDLKFKLDLINNQLASKELYIAKYYIQTQKWVPAIKRLKNIVDNYDQTIFIEEALHRLVEVYYKVGLIEQAKLTATLLGYNYNSSEWYQQSYKLINKNYNVKKMKKIKRGKKDKENSLIKRTFKKLILK